MEKKQATEEICTAWMEDVPGPRLPFRVVHPLPEILPEILFVLFVGQLCGLDDVEEIVFFSKAQLGWFQTVTAVFASYSVISLYRFIPSLRDVDSVFFVIRVTLG